MDTERNRTGSRRLHEGFDFAGMSDTDYTDYFADMDEEAEDIKDFAEGLAPVLWVQTCAGRRRDGGIESRFLGDSWDKIKIAGVKKDPILALISCCRMDDGEIVLDAGKIAIGRLGPKSKSYYTLYRMGMTLRLDKASAEWRNRFGGRWWIDAAPVRDESTAADGVNIELDVIPGKDGSLIGCPRSVMGDVSVDQINFARLGIYNPTSALRTLEGAPEEVSGRFTVYNAELLRMSAAPDGAGWLNHAPAKAGCVIVICSRVKGRPSYILWDRDGRVTVPALTDGVAREWGFPGMRNDDMRLVSVGLSGGDEDSPGEDHMTQPLSCVPASCRPAVKPVPDGMEIESDG